MDSSARFCCRVPQPTRRYRTYAPVSPSHTATPTPAQAARHSYSPRRQSPQLLTESTSPAPPRADRSPSYGQALNQVLRSLGPLNEWLISKPADHTLEASPMLLSRSQFADQVRKTFTRFLCFVQALFFRKVMDALAQHLVEPAEWV